MADVALTNAYFALRLESRHGGRIVSLTTLAGELTVTPTEDELDLSRVQNRFGLLSLQLWQDSYWHNDLCHREWPITNTEVLPDRFAVTLSGQSLLWPGVKVSRRVVITSDPWIDVEHRLDPGSTTGPYLSPAFWFSNVMSGRGRTFVPGPTGMLSYPRWPQDQSWCHEPTDGWIAWIGDTGGLAFVTDPAHLRHFRLCHHSTDRVEWVRRRIASVETTNIRLVPFSGLDHVDGVGAAGIVAVEKSPGGVVADVYAIVTGAGTLTLELLETNGAVTPVATATASLVAGTVSRFTVGIPAWPASASGGSWRFTVAAAPGPTATSFTVPAEGPSLYLRGKRPSVLQVAELSRADSGHRQPPRSFRFDASPAPLPSPWLKRKVDRLRVLALVNPASTPTLLALAHQFDLDLTLPFFPRTSATPTTSAGVAGERYFYELGDRFDSLYGSELVANWSAALSPGEVYDAIVLDIGGRDAWSLLPQTLQAEILARVQAGTGLLTIRRGGPSGPNPETTTLEGLLPLTILSWSDYTGPYHPIDDRTVRGLPWNILPSPGYVINYAARAGATVVVEFAPDPAHPWVRYPLLVRTSYGAGRVLDLAWGPYVVPPDLRRRRQAGAEAMETLRYDLAVIARLIQDVSGRDPSIAIRNVALGGNSATIELEQVDAAVTDFDLDWVARDRFGVMLDSGHQTYAFPAGGTLMLSIPSGTWTVDVSTHPATGEPGWGAGGRTLDFPVTVLPDVAVLGREDAIQISPAGPATATQYVIDMLDGRGRVLVETTIGTGATATLDARRIETPHAELRVHALDAAGALLGQAVRRFRLRHRTNLERWPIHFWNDVRIFPQPLFVRHFDANATLGISAYFRLQSVTESDVVPAADRLGIAYVCQSSGWLYPSGGEAPNGSGGPLSMSDGAAIAAGETADTNKAASSADANVLYYVLADDEPTPPAMDLSHDARTLSQFRMWLANLYGNADSLLQREWGAGFTLSTAVPQSHAQAVAGFATDPTYAHWVDHRRFMMDLFSRLPAIAGDALRRGDPEALTGTSGENLMGLASGRDWWVRARALDVVGRYSNSIAITVKAVGKRILSWTGYDDPDPIIQHRIWNSVGLGEDGLALFNEASLVNPDLSLPEVGRDLSAALLPVRRGVGSLFAHSQPADDGVYVLESPESSIVLAIHGYESLGYWSTGSPPAHPNLGVEAREGAHELLTAMGIGWSTVSPADVEIGALERNGAKVLILPMCIALSDAACRSVARWVAKGGRVVADLLAGTFSAHGRLRGSGIGPTGTMQASTNPLDVVFGFTPGGRPPISNTSVSINAATPFPVRCVDTAGVVTSALAGGSATAGDPLWFQNDYERGRGVYLACSVFADYLVAEPANRLLIEEAFSALLLGLQVEPRARIIDAAGVRIGLCQFRARSLSLTDLIVVLRDYNGLYDPVAPEVDGELMFHGPAHTYDLGNGVYLGFGDRLQLRISAYTFRAFARLPYRVEAVDVQVTGSPRLGDSIVVTAKVITSEGEPCSHYLRLDVLDAKGGPLRHLARETMAECGSAHFEIASAFNDPPGAWTIVVSDVATAVRGEAGVDMGPRTPLVREPEPFYIPTLDD